MNELQTILRLDGIAVAPPTDKRPARATLQLSSDGGRTDHLLQFVGTSCGEAMFVRLTPLKDDEEPRSTRRAVKPWEGRCLIGAASVAAPGKDESIPRVKFSIAVEGRSQGSQAKDDPSDEKLLELLTCRLAMMKAGQVKAEVRLALEQNRLEFPEGGELS